MVKRFLFDTNVLLDLVTGDKNWKQWSIEQLRMARGEGEIVINPVIFAEVAPAFLSREALESWFDPRIFMREPLPFAAAWRAAQAFVQYRKAGGAKLSPLPDFYIGAHAEVEQFTLVTRDAARYRTYFPSVRLISPE